MTENISYSIRSYSYNKKSRFWSIMGFSPAGRTIEEAHDTIRKEMNRIGIDRLTKHNVKFEVVKTITTEEVVEEVLGSDSSFFMLKG